MNTRPAYVEVQMSCTQVYSTAPIIPVVKATYVRTTLYFLNFIMMTRRQTPHKRGASPCSYRFCECRPGAFLGVPPSKNTSFSSSVLLTCPMQPSSAFLQFTAFGATWMDEIQNKSYTSVSMSRDRSGLVLLEISTLATRTNTYA